MTRRISIEEYGSFWSFSATVPQSSEALPLISFQVFNDKHRLNRQCIAEWVSTIEPTDQTSFEGEEFSSVA
jgi:hypothetical protein